MGASLVIEKIAQSVLAREGIAAIWTLHIAAAEAHRTGHPQAAAAILEIAEAAERASLSTNQRLRGDLPAVIAALR
jgi:hypothetical protein